jgi:hypothetical protein
MNAVTWAVFPGQEIVQSTIIEEISFLAWKVNLIHCWARMRWNAHVLLASAPPNDAGGSIRDLD